MENAKKRSIIISTIAIIFAIFIITFTVNVKNNHQKQVNSIYKQFLASGIVAIDNLSTTERQKILEDLSKQSTSNKLTPEQREAILNSLKRSGASQPTQPLSQPLSQPTSSQVIDQSTDQINPKIENITTSTTRNVVDNVLETVTNVFKDTISKILTFLGFKKEEKEIQPVIVQSEYPFVFGEIDKSLLREREMFIDFPILPNSKPLPEGTQWVDAWGYPPQPNYWNPEGINTGGLEGRGLEDDGPLGLNNSNIFEISKAHAQVSPTMNCGGFTAYFEEVAIQKGEGYDDSTLGPARRNAVCNVLTDISGLIDMGTSNPEIIFQQNPVNIGNPPIPPNALAAASTYFPSYSRFCSRFYGGKLWEHITTGIDPGPKAFDGYVITNFYGSVQWNVDTGNSGDYNLETVIYHEIIHALGFLSRIPFTGHPLPDYTSNFDEFLFPASGNLTPLIKDFSNECLVAYVGVVDIPNTSPDLITDNVVYRRSIPFVDERPIYSPNPWEGGSSISHFDQIRAGKTYIMHPSIGTGISKSIHLDEREVLCQIGYGLPGLCDNRAPIAKNDTAPLAETGNEICVNFKNNDLDPDGDPFWIDSINFSGTPTTTWWDDTNKTTSLPMADPNTEVVCYTPTPSFNGKTNLIYTLTDGNLIGKKGAILFQIFKDEYPITDQCPIDSGNYVCNGGLELGISLTDFSANGGGIGPHYSDYPGATSFSGHRHEVNGWWDYGSSDLFIRGYTGLRFPFGSIPFKGVNTWDSPAVGNDRFVAFGMWLLLSPGSEEGIGTKLKQVLQPGVQYEFNMHIHATYGHTAFNPDIIIGLNDIPATKGVNAEFIGGVNGVHSIQNNSQWQNIKFVFSVTRPLDYLFINGMPAPGSGYSLFYMPVDDISIREVLPPLVVDGKISGIVFTDEDFDGILDAGETRRELINAELYKEIGGVIVQPATQTALSNLNGEYIFGDVDRGTYFIRADTYSPKTTPPAGSDNINGDFNLYKVVIDDQNLVYNNQNFGLSYPEEPTPIFGEIMGEKYSDMNGNGKKGLFEKGLAGWTINLYVDSHLTIPVKTTTTSTGTFWQPELKGDYNFSGLPMGTYYVAEVQKTGWRQSQPFPNLYYIITVGNGTGQKLNHSSINFGNFQALIDDSGGTTGRNLSQ